tara:strand:+ start:2233 stop:2988 length:756 start_codon:yes stop_codon:yes gene_type:complete
MITFFTTTNKLSVPFLNSLESWDRLSCVDNIFVFTDISEKTILPYSNKVSVFPSGEENGPPLVRDLFCASFENSDNDYFCYLNSDILLLSDFSDAFKVCKEKWSNFQMIGHRINWFDWRRFEQQETESDIKNEVINAGSKMHLDMGVDYFCFNREVYEKQMDDFPDFKIARQRFDHYLAYAPRRVNAEVVDCTSMVYCIHHDESEESRRKNWSTKPDFLNDCLENNRLFQSCINRDKIYSEGILSARTCEL